MLVNHWSIVLNAISHGNPPYVDYIIWTNSGWIMVKNGTRWDSKANHPLLWPQISDEWNIGIYTESMETLYENDSINGGMSSKPCFFSLKGTFVEGLNPKGWKTNLLIGTMIAHIWLGTCTNQPWNNGMGCTDIWLVGTYSGWWFETWILFFHWECHHPNWRTPSFFRGVGIPPTSIIWIYMG